MLGRVRPVRRRELDGDETVMAGDRPVLVEQEPPAGPDDSTIPRAFPGHIRTHAEALSCQRQFDQQLAADQT
jgi:hypothetical protein